MKFYLPEGSISTEIALVPGKRSERVFDSAKAHRNENSFNTQDLYELLGVDREATSEEIRSAYRSLAARMHPDKNPNSKWHADLFQRINAAYDILSDPTRRKYYDGTGIIPPDEVDLDQRAIMAALNKLASVIDDIANNDNQPERVISAVNPIDLTVEHLEKDLQNNRKEMAKFKSKLKRFGNMQKAFRKKTKNFASSPVNVMLEERIAVCKKNVQVCTLNMKVNTAAIKFLRSKYTFEAYTEEISLQDFDWIQRSSMV